jgi:hypothetical protein
MGLEEQEQLPNEGIFPSRLRRQSVFLFERLSLCYTMSFCFKENIFKSGPSIVLKADVL